MPWESWLLETVRENVILDHRDPSFYVTIYALFDKFQVAMFRARITASRGSESGQLRSEASSILAASKPVPDSSTEPHLTNRSDALTDCNQNPRVCGKEAACRSVDSKTSKCVCPHDLSPPTKDLKCPNRLLAPITPKPIHNIIPPSGNVTNGTTSIPDVEQVEAVWRDDASETIGISIACLTLFAIISIVIYVGRGKCSDNASRRSAQNVSPRSLKNGPLLANKYTPNLQYFGCAPPDVPILRRDSIAFLCDIGEGCFGKVFKGEMRKSESTTEIVAVKVLKDSASREAEEDFAREVEIMSTFRHENILSLLGVVARDSSNGPWMVFEYMRYGDLAGVLRASGKRLSDEKSPTCGLDQPLTESCLHWITLQIAAGMTYLSCQRFVHRDLACRNCLVGANLVVKIADFGMSRDVYTCDYYKIGGSRLLPVRWMSPESVMYGRFTLESDVWSFGVVLWEIYSYGKQPYYGRNNEEVVKLIVADVPLQPPEDCPPLVSEMMHECWRAEPRDRPRFVEILERLEKNGRDRGTAAKQETLPRPPQGPITIRSRDVLDTEGYLLPAPALPIEYLQTLAD